MTRVDKTRIRGLSRGLTVLGAPLFLALLLVQAPPRALAQEQAAAPSSPAPLDADADGIVAAQTDGQLVLRHLFGFTGANLVNGALGSEATRDAAAISEHLGNLQGVLDADGDGNADALSDGLLLLRRLLGQEGAALTDAVLSPGATRDAAAIAAHIDSLGTEPPDYGQAPVRMQLVQANSLTADSIQLDWLPTFDNDTPGSRIRYMLHASEEEGFVPDAATARAEVIDNATGTIIGLTAATTYYVKVEAVDAYGNNSWSNELEVVTANADPVPTSAPRQVLDAGNAPNQSVQPDQLQYDLGPGAAPPGVGEYLVSTEGNGFLRRATGVQRNGDQVTVTTEPAALNELYENLDFSASIKLVDLPDSAAPQARAVGRGVVFQRSGDTVRATWPESGLSIMERRPPSATPRAAQPRAAGGVCNGRDGEGGERWDDHDFERVLKVSYVKRICIEPGHTLSIDVAAEIEPEEWEHWEITQLFFLSMRHPGSYLSGFGEQWNPPNAGSDVIGWGTLTWTPKQSHVDDDLRPYTARFVAIAKEREGHCTGFLGRCNTKRVYVETDIVVSWGEYPTQRRLEFTKEGALRVSVDGSIDFEPEIDTTTQFRGRRLVFGRAALKGPISLTTTVRATATGSVTLQPSVEPLGDWRFTKIFVVSGAPIVVSGHLKLDLQYKGSASGKIDLSQTLVVGYDLLAGLQYSNGNWEILTKATPWQSYDLHGEAEAHAYVELRLVPDLEIAFYDVVTGQLIVEPYLYGEAEVEGHFMYNASNSSAGFTDVEDADYRFTKLEFGGGVDARFRAALEVLDYTIAEDVWPGPLVARKRFWGLPALTPAVGACGIEDCAQLGLEATVEDVPNPFGGDSLYPFVPESANWEVVFKDGGEPDGTEQIEPDDEDPLMAWFKAEDTASYTLRFSGHSKIGSFVRQYEDISLDYDRSDCCARWAVLRTGEYWYEISSDHQVTALGDWSVSEDFGSITPDAFSGLTSTADGRVYMARVSSGTSYWGVLCDPPLACQPQKVFLSEVDFDRSSILAPTVHEVEGTYFLRTAGIGGLAVDSSGLFHVSLGVFYHDWDNHGGARMYRASLGSSEGEYGVFGWMESSGSSMDFAPSGQLFGWSRYYGLLRIEKDDDGYFRSQEVKEGDAEFYGSNGEGISAISFGRGGSLYGVGQEGEECRIYSIDINTEEIETLASLGLDGSLRCTGETDFEVLGF